MMMVVEIFQDKQRFECNIFLLTNVASYCQIHSDLHYINTQSGLPHLEQPTYKCPCENTLLGR